MFGINLTLYLLHSYVFSFTLLTCYVFVTFTLVSFVFDKSQVHKYLICVYNKLVIICFDENTIVRTKTIPNVLFSSSIYRTSREMKLFVSVLVAVLILSGV